MRYEIDLSRKPANLNTLEYLLLAFYEQLDTHVIEDLALTDETLFKLESEGYVRIVEVDDENVIDIRAKGLEFAVTEVAESADSGLDWIEDYRNLFKDRYSRTGIKGSKSGVEKKMKEFLKKNPKVTKEEILGATNLYLDSLDDYKYMQQADYFIIKNGMSRLEAYVEEYREQGSSTKTVFVEGI